MKLLTAQVRLFRNILDSTEVPIQPDITCLVGKNESGKTAYLHALYRLKPARPNVSFSVPTQYPAWREKKDRQAATLEEVQPVTAVFELEPADSAVVVERFGTSVLLSNTVELSRTYGNKLFYSINTDEARAVQNLVAQLKIPQASLTKEARSRHTFSDLLKLAAEWKARGAEHPNEQDSGGQKSSPST